MAIMAGGLATGMDTASLIQELMKVERAPVTRLNYDKSFQNHRLSAFGELNTKLEALLDTVSDFESSSTLLERSAVLSSEGYFTAALDSSAALGSYSVEVVDLAQVQKSVSQGYADKTSQTFGIGTIQVTVDGVPTDVTIDASNNSLSGIADAINSADAGVTASIINDGTAAPYRLVLTGSDTASTFTFDASGLTGGSETNPATTVSQVAQQAHVRVDGIDIYSTENTLKEAIPGVTLNLLDSEPGTVTTLMVTNDNAAIEEKINSFVSQYNEIVTFATNSGSIGNDSGVRSLVRNLQRLLVSSDSSRGLFELGLQTEKDGTLKVDSSTLSSAIGTRLDEVQSLLTGTDGVANAFVSYLEGMTDFSDGIYANRKESINSMLSKIDTDIERIENRLSKREESLVAQFTAMEQLVSALNAQSEYLTQQMTMLNNMRSK